jgi:AcrR family transcriptional regulator
MKATARTYRMGARAESAAATYQRIVDVAIRLLGERQYDDVSLAEVAAAAAVTVQTVLRRFGSKEGLAEAASQVAMEAVRAQRWAPAPGDLPAAMRSLAEHYDTWGDRSLRFLAQEERVPAVRRVTDAGRAMHQEWVAHVFAPWLRKTSGAARTRLHAQLVAATDVYVWKIMRRDLGLDAKATETAMRELVTGALAERA